MSECIYSELMTLLYTVHWATLTFDLAFCWAFRWAKVRSKYRLKSKSKV